MEPQDDCELARFLRASRIESELVLPNYLREDYRGNTSYNTQYGYGTIFKPQTIFAEAIKLVRRHKAILSEYDGCRSYVFNRFCARYRLDASEALRILNAADNRIRMEIPSRITAYASRQDPSLYSPRDWAIYLTLVRMTWEEGARVLTSLRTLADRAALDLDHKQVKRSLEKLMRGGLIESIEWGLPNRQGRKPIATKILLHWE